MTVTSFMEIESRPSGEKNLSKLHLIVENVSCLGKGRIIDRVSSINTTYDIFGLQTAESCTHNNPICMHLNASLLEHAPAMEGSISSTAFPSFQRCNA